MAYTVNTYGDGNPKYNRNARTGTVKYIVIHYTANGRPTTANAAKNNCIYFSGGDRQASAHYFIDESSIWCFADPAKWSCWHVGDGGGAYGITNQNSVGIEVVQDGNNAFSTEEVNKLTWLVQRLMAQFSVPAERVVRHYDASRKSCPLWYTPSGSGGNAAWEALRKRITTKEVTPVATLRDKVVEKARSQLGVRYWSMHSGPKGSKSEGWGCAMFCAWCLNQVLGTSFVGGSFNFWGEVIGAPTYNQGRTYAFEEIGAGDAQPGDLVCYFYPDASIGYSSSCGHIAMYVGNGRVIGAMGRGTPGSSDYLNIGIKETAVSAQNIGGFVRYIRCKALRNVKATAPATGASTTKTAKGDFKVSKTVTFKTKTNVRDQPSITKGKVVTYYEANQSVTIDAVSIADGIVWGHYVGASSGKDRYVSLTGTIK